jgi:hypothetical protein
LLVLVRRFREALHRAEIFYVVVEPVALATGWATSVEVDQESFDVGVLQRIDPLVLALFAADQAASFIRCGALHVLVISVASLDQLTWVDRGLAFAARAFTICCECHRSLLKRWP